jgi:hypothetical protein
MTVNLSANASRHLNAEVAGGNTNLQGAVVCTLRRFDLAELKVAVGEPPAQRMVGLRPSPLMFMCRLSPDACALTIDVHRKHLPISASFGGAAFVFVVYIPGVSEVVVSSQCRIVSKQPRTGGIRRPAKRVRGPGQRVFTPDDSVNESAMNAALAAHCALVKRQEAMASAGSTAAVPRDDVVTRLVPDGERRCEETSVREDFDACFGPERSQEGHDACISKLAVSSDVMNGWVYELSLFTDQEECDFVDLKDGVQPAQP